MLKFRFGKCYGDNTRQIMREIRANDMFKKPFVYRAPDRYEIENVPPHDRPYPDHLDDIRHRGRGYVTGYTGYVPGLNFRYGKSYGLAADDSMAEFGARQGEWRRRRGEAARAHARSRSAPKMATVRTRDEVRRALDDHTDARKYRDNTISAEFPPIAGYTGHIPRIKGSEASLSQRYHCAAKRGLELIQMERESRLQLQNADENIKAILKEGRNHSYWNWG